MNSRIITVLVHPNGDYVEFNNSTNNFARAPDILSATRFPSNGEVESILKLYPELRSVTVELKINVIQHSLVSIDNIRSIVRSHIEDLNTEDVRVDARLAKSRILRKALGILTNKLGISNDNLIQFDSQADAISDQLADDLVTSSDMNEAIEKISQAFYYMIKNIPIHGMRAGDLFTTFQSLLIKTQ